MCASGDQLWGGGCNTKLYNNKERLFACLRMCTSQYKRSIQKKLKTEIGALLVFNRKVNNIHFLLAGL